MLRSPCQSFWDNCLGWTWASALLKKRNHLNSSGDSNCAAKGWKLHEYSQCAQPSSDLQLEWLHFWLIKEIGKFRAICISPLAWCIPRVYCIKELAESQKADFLMSGAEKWSAGKRKLISPLTRTLRLGRSSNYSRPMKYKPLHQNPFWHKFVSLRRCIWKIPSSLHNGMWQSVTVLVCLWGVKPVRWEDQNTRAWNLGWNVKSDCMAGESSREHPQR